VPGGGRSPLCVTEIVSYGVIYYAFPVLATQITAGTGWSRTAVTLAYSAGNLAGALAGVPVGRLIQRHGPRPVMTAGSVLGALAVAGIATAPGYGWFVAAWLAAGIATAGLYYPPAFAALTTWYGPRRVAALTTLTLAAGFASTIFAPLTSGLAGPVGRRGTYLLLAAVLAAVTIPAHALFLRLPWTPPSASPGQAGPARDADRSVLASRAFLLLVTAATLCAFAQYAALVNLVPLLTGRSMTPGLAAWALGLGGAGQVAGRLCYRQLAARLGTRWRTVAVIAAGAGVTLLLGLLPGPAALLVAASVLAGAVRRAADQDPRPSSERSRLPLVRPARPARLASPARGEDHAPRLAGACGRGGGTRRRARRPTRCPRSSRAASKLAGSPDGTGSGTDQCTAARPPSSSRARSHTVTTRSPSS
jgi:MFS family permease